MTPAPYPDLVCFDCGARFGQWLEAKRCCTVHLDKCGICGETKAVTEPRDFGHLRPDWRKDRQAAGGVDHA